jgi:CRP/FNR family cyclic AMP-dependent transcriptional regulator
MVSGRRIPRLAGRRLKSVHSGELDMAATAPVGPLSTYPCTGCRTNWRGPASMSRETEAPVELKALLTKAGDGRTILKVRPKKTVFAQGDPAEAVFYIQQGKIKLTVLSAAGKEAVLAILGKGEFFGQDCLVGQMHTTFTASALIDCILMRLEKSVAARLIKQHPAFAARLMAFLLQRSIRMQEDMIDQLFNSSEKRLARVLLLLADFGSDDRAESVIPRISQETLAEMIGTTRSRVNTFMNEFRRLGFINYNGTVRVRSTLLQVLLRD